MEETHGQITLEPTGVQDHNAGFAAILTVGNVRGLLTPTNLSALIAHGGDIIAAYGDPGRTLTATVTLDQVAVRR